MTLLSDCGTDTRMA